jgi:hypothetical protein
MLKHAVPLPTEQHRSRLISWLDVIYSQYGNALKSILIVIYLLHCIMEFVKINFRIIMICKSQTIGIKISLFFSTEMIRCMHYFYFHNPSVFSYTYI